MSSGQSATLRKEQLVQTKGIFYGWWVALGVFLVVFAICGAGSSFSVMVVPLRNQFGWAKTDLSWASSIYQYVWLTSGMVFGFLIDRVGVRWVVFFGAMMSGTAMILLRFTDSLWYWYVVYGVMFAMGYGVIRMVASGSTLRRWFMKNAAVGVSVMEIAACVGTVVTQNVASRLINNWGWENTYYMYGGVVLVCGTIGAFLIRQSPEKVGLYPDNEKPDPDMVKKRMDFMSRQERWSLKEAMLTPTFWLYWVLNAGTMVGMIGIATWGVTLGVTIKLMSGEAFHNALNAGIWVLCTFSLCAAVGAIISGRTSDLFLKRFPHSMRKWPILFALCGNLISLMVFLFWGGDGFTNILVTMVFFGFFVGMTLSPIITFIGDLFGVINMPVIFGVMAFLFMAFMVPAPWLYSWSLENWNNADRAIMATAGIQFISIVALLLIQKPKKSGKAAAPPVAPPAA